MKKHYPGLFRKFCWLLALSFACVFPLQAQQTPAHKEPLDFGKSISAKKNKPGLEKVPSDLLVLKQEFSAFKSAKPNARSSQQTLPFKPSNRLLQVLEDRFVIVDAVATGNAAALAADLKAMGATRVTVFKQMVSAVVPIEGVDRLETLANLRFVRAAYQPYKNVGAVTSQGDRSQRSDLARAKYSVDGTGTKVGILSDSYNALGGAKAGVLSGDLPGVGNPNGYLTPVEVLLDFPFGIDEGRGMAEIVHDVAPGAKQAFYSAYYGQADFAQGIIDLKTKAGCDIIVDDIIYLDEPFFQDGIVAQAVDSVKAMGVSYFSSAGNNGRQSYESPFRPDKGIDTLGTLHEFAPGVTAQPLLVRPNDEVYIDFQWSDPFGSLGGEGARSDLDIYILDRNGNEVGRSDFSNRGADPFEIYGGVNGTTDSLFYLVVSLYGGPAPAKIKYVIFGPGAILDYNTNTPTLFGHANAAGAIATGAAFYAQTPAFGVNPPKKEDFSSAGGIPILFNTEGRAIAPIVRKKPEVVGPDGGNNTFFPPAIYFGNFDVEGDGFPNFFGTSASAPHVAAVAALMKQAANTDLSPDKVKRELQAHALDMDQPGFDFNTGYGLVDAEASVLAVLRTSVRYLLLFNPANGQILDTLTAGKVINLATLPAKVNIRAVTNPATVGSVWFNLNGKIAVENSATYDFAGTGNGISLAVGSYMLMATPYSEAKAKGKKGETLTVTFKVVDEAIKSFVLFNADNNQVLTTIKEGDVLNLAALPKRLNIRAITAPAKLGSVVFDLNGKTVVENTATYDFAGTGGAVDLKVGDYTLKAIPYHLAGGKGTAGGSLTVQFKVVNNSIARMVAEAEPNFQGGNKLQVAPNPFSSQAQIRFRLVEADQVSLNVYDSRGALIATLHKGEAEGGKEYTYELEGHALQQGVYISRLITTKGVLHQKMILRR
jgi:hypothetical protein